MKSKARETVYVTRRQHVTKRYHTSEDCENIGERYREVEKGAVQPVYELCAYCDDDKVVRQTDDDEPKRCPYCGDSFGRLPAHLPKCEET